MSSSLTITPTGAIHPDSNQNRNPRENKDLVKQRSFRHDAEGNGDNFRGQNKIGANRAFYFVTLKGQRIALRQRGETLLPPFRILFVFPRFQTVQYLLHPFETEKRAPPSINNGVIARG